MKILALDVATNIGAALYEGGNPATIKCWGDRIERNDIAAGLAELIGPWLKQHLPDLVVAEAPLAGLVFHSKKPDLAGLPGIGMSTAALTLNRISGAVEMLVHLHAIPYEEVQPRVWQAAILKGIHGADTKERAKNLCDSLGIKEASNEHKRDAACIALWAWTASQKRKWIIHNDAQIKKAARRGLP